MVKLHTSILNVDVLYCYDVLYTTVRQYCTNIMTILILSRRIVLLRRIAHCYLCLDVLYCGLDVLYC